MLFPKYVSAHIFLCTAAMFRPVSWRLGRPYAHAFPIPVFCQKVAVNCIFSDIDISCHIPITAYEKCMTMHGKHK